MALRALDRVLSLGMTVALTRSMKRKTNKRLELNRETVRILDKTSDLRRVVGGDDDEPGTYSLVNCPSDRCGTNTIVPTNH
jgi:hypothetical protein